jgi:hypothetical protein
VTQWLVQIAVSVAAGGILIAIKILLASRDKQGERLGRIEKWVDREEGRRLGIAEGHRGEQRKE